MRVARAVVDALDAVKGWGSDRSQSGFQPFSTAIRRMFHAIVTNDHSPRTASSPAAEIAGTASPP